MLLELFLLGNAMLIAFLMCSWMESDAFAYSASELDWWELAVKRFLLLSVLSVIASAIVWKINKQLFAWSGFKNEQLPVITARITLVSLCVAGLVGAVIFAVTKPYM
ncbi:hypothetical protein [Microbulbifer sediminum]|uniref:hypothetical protein n=1 Tax=Microbulbifer sediminum TaxID=2904250 RepID=UPI001F463AAD|nr:hypothetical protein [Microbulbifer sediminum]